MNCGCTPLTKYACLCEPCQRAFHESLRIAEYSNWRMKPIEERYDTRGDMAPDGRNIADTNRMVIRPQILANMAYSASLKGKR